MSFFFLILTLTSASSSLYFKLIPIALTTSHPASQNDYFKAEFTERLRPSSFRSFICNEEYKIWQASRLSWWQAMCLWSLRCHNEQERPLKWTFQVYNGLLSRYIWSVPGGNCGHHFHEACPLVGLRMSRFKYIRDYVNWCLMATDDHKVKDPSAIHISLNWLVQRNEIWCKTCKDHRKFVDQKTVCDVSI